MDDCVDHKMDVVRDTYFEQRTMIFKTNLHNLKALFRRQSIYVEMPNQTKHNHLTADEMAAS